MRKDFGPKTWLYPMPVLIIGTYDENGEPDAMNAAYGGIFDDRRIAFYVGRTYVSQTQENIAKNRAFTISIGTKDTVVISDYVGIVTKMEDKKKMDRTGLHAFKSKFVNAPLFEEFPFTLECKLVTSDDSCLYRQSGVVIGEIVNVSIDESILTNGKVDVKKLQPIAYDPINNKYILLEEEVATAFSVGKTLIKAL